MPYALISVFDKIGIVDFAKQISSLGYKIISTDGTYKHLLSHIGSGKLIPIEEITGNPESFDGRMKTISFQIEGGILFDRKNPKHVKQASSLKIPKIDIVVCNLYPFEEKPSIENIDVGGPTMIRAAAKNFQNVIVIVDPKDYGKVTEHIMRSHSDPQVKNFKIGSGDPSASPQDDEGDIEDDKFRKDLAAKAFYHLSFYDSQIATVLNKKQFPEELTIPLRLNEILRYGENPHQKAALYLEPGTNSPLKNLKHLWGRELSLVNITDINAGLESVKAFKNPCAVVIKHNTPCGVALGDSPSEALQRAIDADAESAFGGVIVMNTGFDLASAKIVASFKEEKRGNIDIIASPKIEKNALTLLQKVRKTMGIYSFGKVVPKLDHEMNLKWVEGGLIVQTPDNEIEESFKSWEIVTKIKPTKKQMEQMKLAWIFLTKMRSNAVIVIDKNLPMTRGIGTGQTARVRSTKIALEQAGKFVEGAVLASDSFFPFGDSVKEAAKYKVGTIIQQGDSINDKESINEANKASLPMVFTHHRAFWH